MVAFVVFLLLIAVVSSAIVAAFALPQLRAGAPILTDKGDRLARRAGRPLRPFHDRVWPRLCAVGGPVVRVLRTIARPATRPLVEAVRPRVAPLAQAISRAVEEGSVPVTQYPSAAPVPGTEASRRESPADPADPASPRPRRDAFDALRLRGPVVNQAKRSAA